MKEIKNYIGNLTRMFHCLFNLVPQLFILVMVIAVLDAILPYVNIIAMNEKFLNNLLNSISVSGYEEQVQDIVTEEMKVTISATYVMLTFGMREYLNPLFKRIVIYPDIYYSSQNDNYHKGEFNPRLESIVFSWKHFKEGIDISNDNLNLGLHEFTHAFHIYALKSDKVTFVLFNESLQNLFRVVSKPEVKQRLVASGFLRDYAYENQFEFIAVILEHFFETPHLFKSKYPELYQHVSSMINFKEKNLDDLQNC